MDDCANLLARATQCRRLASSLLDPATLETLQILARELEDRAAIAATADLRPAQAALDGRYVISRAPDGWLISRGPDRLAVRATLEDARDEVQRLAGFDNAAE